MARLLGELRRLNDLGDRRVAEPFAGGAGASLSLLYREETHHIYINDADPALHAFWWTLVNRPQSFANLLSETPVTIAEWHRQRQVYRSRGRRVSRLHRGFSAFYLNRCNRSGIIMNGGPIGGIEQAGNWKLDARYKKSDLRRRCDRVAEYRARISVSGDDGLQFIKRLDLPSIFFFIDPPYYEKGQTLYLNGLDTNYHEALAAQLKRMAEAAWVITYDDCPEVRRLYRGWAAIRPFSLRYVAAEKRMGRELLITPEWMRLPTEQASNAIVW